MACVSSQGIKTLLPPNVSLEKLFTMSPVCFVHHVPGQHRIAAQGAAKRNPGWKSLNEKAPEGRRKNRATIQRKLRENRIKPCSLKPKSRAATVAQALSLPRRHSCRRLDSRPTSALSAATPRRSETTSATRKHTQTCKKTATFCKRPRQHRCQKPLKTKTLTVSIETNKPKSRQF